MAPPHFVLLPLQSPGHLFPMADLARLLAQCGAVATLITTPANARRISSLAAGAARDGLAVRVAEVPFPGGVESNDLISNPDDFVPFFNNMYALQGPLERLLRSLSPAADCAVVDGCSPWAAPVVDALGIRRLAFHGPSCFFNLADHLAVKYKVYYNLPADPTEPYTVPNMPAAAPATFTSITGPGFFHAPGWEKIRDDANAAALTAAGVVLNTYRHLEKELIECYEREHWSNRVYAVGPVFLYNENVDAVAAAGGGGGAADKGVVSWLDGRAAGTVVYVSFGSLARKRLPQLAELGRGLETSGRPFVLVVKDGDLELPGAGEWVKEFEERNAGRGLVVRGWSPQLAALAHPAVGCFVTHCGWSSMLEAFAAGVPVVTWPHFFDQFMNERLAVEVLGAGVPVGGDGSKFQGVIPEDDGVAVSAEMIASAVERVMDGGEEAKMVRAAVGKLREEARRAVANGGTSLADAVLLVQSAGAEVKDKDFR